MTLITGGQRSGKSTFALNYCEDKSDSLLFVATCEPRDAEMSNRISRHQKDRSDKWNLLEESLYLSKLDLFENQILIDCVTLWLSNIFFYNDESVEKSISFAKYEIDQISIKDKNITWVTNEIGLGVIPESELSRKFCDLQGWVNQYLAKNSSSVYFLISGIAQKIK